MSGPRLALVFPGQGAQQPGMGRLWSGRPGWSLAERASEISGRDVPELLLRADAETLRRTDNAQLATFVLEMVVLAELRRCLPAARRPVVCAGHSLGEYAALVAAGIVGFDDGVRLVTARGEAMRRACAAEPGTMAAVVGLPPEDVEKAAQEIRDGGGRVWVANLNSPQQSVLSGEAGAVAACSEAAERFGAARIVPIPVGGAFHTPLMESAANKFARVADAVEYLPGHTPVVANVDARPHQEPGGWPWLLTRQITAPVRWADSVRAMADETYCDMFVEVGPGRTLTGLARRIAPEVSRLSIAEPGQLPPVPAPVRNAA
ncbi:ACP S-malonyltransferase [Streptomyces chitinivorans]|uniref:Malonyl CoA-acyl carrier protein transacylase n=1 Tax=Streptomyces chitinivorans TaxID=1257027 RepID=A0ABW7HZA9_9ACTN|nr:ACP S-malonyltransferase [Streptomyces chitinivorans]MDH2411577.1 ACP S-malonyltransferase [Streptomyces chitinivorans]